jgi:hypothetical protein
MKATMDLTCSVNLALACLEPKAKQPQANAKQHEPKADAKQPKAGTIHQQCGPDADPLYQNFRFGIICDTIAEFRERGIGRGMLERWEEKFHALYPWSLGYDIYRQNVNRRFTIFPWIIAMTTREKEVVRALSAARRYNLPLCLRGGAHAYEPYSICDGLVIDQSRRARMVVDPVSSTVTIESGVLNGPLAVELGRYGLAVPQGTCANVGVAGLCLGGGMGFLGRRFGLTSDSLRRFKLLVADGRLLSVDRDHHPDLFWACQGAGNGNFGIVTELTLQAYPVKEVVVFEFRWPIERLPEVLAAYFEWLSHKNSIGIEMDIFRIAPDNPNPIMITGMGCKGENKLQVRLYPFLDLKPSVQKFRPTTYVESVRHWTYEKFPPPFFKNKSYFAYTSPPPEVSEVIVRYMTTAGPNDRLELNGLGSAYDRGQSAWSHRGALVWCQLLAKWGTNVDDLTEDPWEDQRRGPASIAWVTNFYTHLRAAWGAGARGAYVGCFDSQLSKPLIDYYGSNLPRLLEIKAKVDPDGIFSYPQGLSQPQQQAENKDQTTVGQ